MRVQQLYCTHCTYGSSALEQRRGELAGETLGYSVRAGSLSGEELRRLYRQVERHMSYHLPGDTPPERKLRLDAATAPRRLMFVPSADGSALLAQVCYRTTDTAGRPGSYFAHALVSQPDAGGRRWTALEAIRTWSSPQWVTTDHDRIPARLDEYDSLAAWIDNGRPQTTPGAAATSAAAPDDAAMLAFLRGGEVGGLVPDRLASVPAEKRRQLLTAALERFWEVLRGRADSLVLLAEPGLAALVFYALLRLVPPEACGRDVGFSTFEPTPERVTTLLGATCHDDPRRDLPPECYRAGYHVVSTVEPFRTTPLRGEAARYPALMLERLHAAGWSGVDAMHVGFRAVGAAGPPQWERLALAHDEATWLFTGGPAARLPEDVPPFVRDYLRRVVIELLTRPGAEERVQSLDAATHAALLRLIGQPEDAAAESALAVLLDQLPAAEASRFLQDGRQSLERRRAVALRHLRTHGRWPDGVPLRPLLPMLLGGLSADELKSLHAHLSPPQRAEFLTILLEGRAGNPAADRMLTAAVDAPDDETLCRRLNEAPFPALLRADAPAGERLRQRISQMIAELRSDPARGVSRLGALERAAGSLGEPERQAVRKWADLRDALAAAAGALHARTGPARWFGGDSSVSGHGEGGPWATLYGCLAQMPIPAETAREIEAAENRLEKRLRVVGAAQRSALPLLDDIGNPNVLWPRMNARVQAEVITAASDTTFVQFLASPFGRQLLGESEAAAAAARERIEHMAGTLTADPAHFRRRLDLLGTREAREMLGPQAAASLQHWGPIGDQIDSLRAVVYEHPSMSRGECPEAQTPRVAKIGRTLGRLFASVPESARQVLGPSAATGERGWQAWHEHAREFTARSVNIPPDQPPQLWEAFAAGYFGNNRPAEPQSQPQPSADQSQPAERWCLENWLPAAWRPANGGDIDLFTPKVLGWAVGVGLVLGLLGILIWKATHPDPPAITVSDQTDETQPAPRISEPDVNSHPTPPPREPSKSLEPLELLQHDDPVADPAADERTVEEIPEPAAEGENTPPAEAEKLPATPVVPASPAVAEQPDGMQ